MKMKKIMIRSEIILFYGILFSFMFSSCVEMYISGKRNETAGLNGSFEIADGGYSVNWQFNAPPIKDGSTRITIDTTVFRDGKQSLKISAKKVIKSDRVWQKPGLSTQIPVVPGKKYHLSFWARNMGCAFYVKWISATSNQKRHLRSGYVMQTEESFSQWKVFSDTLYTGKDETGILLDFVITRPGTLWIDNVMFEELNHVSILQSKNPL